MGGRAEGLDRTGSLAPWLDLRHLVRSTSTDRCLSLQFAEVFAVQPAPGPSPLARSFPGSGRAEPGTLRLPRAGLRPVRTPARTTPVTRVRLPGSESPRAARLPATALALATGGLLFEDDLVPSLGSRPCPFTPNPVQHRLRHACSCSGITRWQSRSTLRTAGSGRWS